MNIRISSGEEYFPQNTANNRFDNKNNQHLQSPSQPMRNNFVTSIIQNSIGNGVIQNGSSQHLRNQSSPSPSLNQQKVITGRKLDNQTISININSTKQRVLPIQRFPIVIESSRKRMNSDSESSIFTQRNIPQQIEQNQVDFHSGENISMIKCESARPSSKNIVKNGSNFFSSLKKIPQQNIDYQLQSMQYASQSSIAQDIYIIQQNQLQKQPQQQGPITIVENGEEDYQTSLKSNHINSNKNNHTKQMEINKKKMKKKVEEKKAILASTLSPTTTNNSKQISTNDGSNKENMGDLLIGQESQPQQQAIMQTNPQTAQKSQKKHHRKSASQTFSPSQYINREQLVNGKESKKKKKNQLFLYSNLSSPQSISKSVKRQLQLEISSGQISKLNQVEGINPHSSNSSTQILNGAVVSDQKNATAPIQFCNTKSKSSHSLINNNYDQYQNQNANLQHPDYLGVSENKQFINKNQGLESKLSQHSSNSDLANQKKKIKKQYLNGNGITIKSSKNGQVRQVSLKKKRVQNSIISNGSNGNYNHMISMNIKKQQAEQNSKESHGSPFKKMHRQTASLINFNSFSKQIENSSPQAQFINSYKELKRQKSEHFQSFINENALKIQREMEDKKKREEQEKQKKLIEKAQLKEKNETIRKKNLVRYSARSTHKHPNEVNPNRMMPWGSDQQKLQRLFFKEIQVRDNQKDYFSHQVQNRGEITSPNKKKIDPKQRRITLGLECLNQLNESAIQSLINTQKVRATQSVHLKDESKRAFSPEDKKQIQEFMAQKKKQIETDYDKRKKDKLLQQERLKLNLENLKNEIKEQISSCKSSKGNMHQSSYNNNQSSNQQNSSSKKAKSSTRHVKSLTFSTAQFDNFLHSNSQYSSHADPNQLLSNNINLSPQPDDQVFEYLNEEYQKNFNWRDQIQDINSQFQSAQNFHQSISTYSNQKDENSTFNPNKHGKSASPQKSGSSKKKNDKIQSNKIEFTHHRQGSDQQQKGNQYYQNYDSNYHHKNAMQPQRLQFQNEEDLIHQYSSNHLANQQQYYGQEDYQNYYNQNDHGNISRQQQQQFLERKNQIYVQYTKLSQRLQQQMFKSMKQQQMLQLQQQQQQQQKQDQQAQLLNQYSHRNQIQEIQEEYQEQNDDFDEGNPNQNGYDIPAKYYHEKEHKSEEEKQLNLSFDKGNPDSIQNNNQDSSLSSIQQQENSNSNSNNPNLKYLQPEESAKLDNSNNVNAFDLYKQTEMSSIKNNSALEMNTKRSDLQISSAQLLQSNVNQNMAQQNQKAQIHQQNRQKSHSDQLQASHKQNQDIQNIGTNLVDEIPTILSDASSNFQAEYENVNQLSQGQEGENSYGMNEEELEEYMYFNIAAIYIQKVWRGYYTRKLLRDFFDELEEMYNKQRQEEFQRNLSTEQSSNSQKNKQNKNNRYSQEDQLYNQIQNGNKGDKSNQNLIQNEYAKMNEQPQVVNNNGSGQKLESIGSSDDNIQPLLIDLNSRNKQKQQQADQNPPFKNVAIQQKVCGSPQQNLDFNEDSSSSRNFSNGKKQQPQENQIQSQTSKNSHPNKANLENLISPIDPHLKDQKKRNESLQMQEINEFSKSLVTLKDFEKSSDNNIPSKNKFDCIQKYNDDNQMTDSQFQDDTPIIQKPIPNEEMLQNNNFQLDHKNDPTQESNQEATQKYQDSYRKIQEEQIHKWNELLNDLQSLQNTSQNGELIKKLCEKYENSKKQLIDNFQHLMQDEQMPQSVKDHISQSNQKSDNKKDDSHTKEISDRHNKSDKSDDSKEQKNQFEESPRQKQKDYKKHNQGVLKRTDKEQELNNMRLVLGQEQLLRDQNAIAAALSQSSTSEQFENQSNQVNYTKKNVGLSGLSQSLDFFENRPKQINEKQKNIPNRSEYIFEKLPFRDFASEKYSRLMLKKESMDDLIKMREEIIQCQKEAKLSIINQMFEQKKISAQVYETKKKEVEQWVNKEQERLLKNQNEIERGWKRFADTVRQTKRGIEFMKQIKKIDYSKLLMSSSDESRFNKILSFRNDSEASESDIFSERRDYHSLSFNFTNQRSLSGINQTNGPNISGGVSPNNIKIIDQYQLSERPKKFLVTNQGQKYIQNGTGKGISGAYTNSKSCTSWDGNILNTNNSEEVEYDDINDYLQKMKHVVAKNLPVHQLYGGQGIQVPLQYNNISHSDEFSTISPGFSRSHTPILKNTEENLYNFKKKEDQDNIELNKQNTPIKNFEISPDPKQKLQTQLTNTQQSESDFKKVGLLSLESVGSSLQSQNSDYLHEQQQFEFENAKRLQQDKIKEELSQQQQETRVKRDETDKNGESKQQNNSSNAQQTEEDPKNDLMSIEQKAKIVSDTIIEDLIDEVKDEIYGIKQKDYQTPSDLSPNNSQLHQSQDYLQNALVNEVMPTGIDEKNQLEEKIIPIESCANLNSIKDFLVALAEFIKENFREEFLGRVNQPLGIDPLEFLKTFNITENTEPQDTETSNAPIYPLVKYIHVQKPVVSEEIFLTFNELYQRMIRRQKRLENRDINEEYDEDKFDDEDDDDIDIFNSQSDIEKYNLKLIFDCFNEALDFLRPFSLGGKPLPWKLNQKKLANMKVKDFDIEKVLGMAIGRTLKWGSCLCGFIPEKIEFPPGQDEENNEYLNQIKEDRLAQMLENEVLENEHKWLIYEEEETDVQLEIADDIFHYLMSETAQWMYLKMQGKLELMESLEINIGRDHKQNFDDMVEDDEDQKQLLDYQGIQSKQETQGSGQKNNFMRNPNVWNLKKQITPSDSNIHNQGNDDQYPNNYEDDDENLIIDLDNPSQKQIKKRKSVHQNHVEEDDDDQDNYENDYFSNKNMQKVKEEMRMQKRKMGKQEEIQSKQNEKLVFQRKQQTYSPTNQFSQHHHPSQEFSDQLIQEKYAQIMGSSTSKQSSLNSSF